MRIKKVLTLVKMLLKSSSIFNQLKNKGDKKKRRSLITNLIAYSIVYAYGFGFCMFLGYGYSEIGIGGYLPVLSIVAVSSLTFFFTLFKANAYLIDYKGKEYLLSLPFTNKEIVLARFIFMYVKGLLLQMVFVVGFIASYVVFLNPPVLFVIVWLILGIIIPIIPTTFATFIGMFIGKATAKFKYKKALQLVLSFAIIFCAMFSNVFIERFTENVDMSEFILNIGDKINGLSNFYAPAKWTENILYKHDILSFVLVVVACLTIVYILVEFTAKSYLRISTSSSFSSSSIKNKKYVFKKRSVEQTIAFKEFKRFLGSPNYLINAGFGLLFAGIISIASLFIGKEKLIGIFAQGINVSDDFAISFIPFVVYLLVGMFSTTVVTPSLEGKNIWIVQSLPLSKKKLYKGKILFNLELMMPIALISTALLSKTFEASMPEIIVNVLVEAILVVFSTIFGLIIGDKLIKLDFENDVEVVKQSAAAFVYIFGNMILTVASIFLLVELKTSTSISFVLVVPIAIYSILCIACWFVVCKFCW